MIQPPDPTPSHDIFERSPSMLAVASVAGRLVAVNPAFAAALGGDPSLLLGTSITDLVYPEDADDVLALLAAPSPRWEPHRWRHADGTVRTLALATSPAQDPEHVHLAAADVTDERERWSTVASRVSHDVRGPLRAIDGFAGILLRDPESLPEGTRRYLDLVRDAAAELDRLLEGLVAYLRIDEPPLRREALDMTALAREIAVRHAAEGRTIEVGELPTAHADRARAAQVLEELVSNAVRAGAASITVRWDGAYTVTDDGIGLDTRHAARALALFGRLHDRGDYPPGAGAGLAVVARIVALHGGVLRVEASPGAGATFSFTLPA